MHMVGKKIRIAHKFYLINSPMIDTQKPATNRFPKSCAFFSLVQTKSSQHIRYAWWKWAFCYVPASTWTYPNSIFHIHNFPSHLTGIYRRPNEQQHPNKRPKTLYLLFSHEQQQRKLTKNRLRYKSVRVKCAPGNANNRSHSWCYFWFLLQHIYSLLNHNHLP